MIIQWIWNWIADVVQTLLQGFLTLVPAPPSFITGLWSNVANYGGVLDMAGRWLPFGMLYTIAGIWLTLRLFDGAVTFGRHVLSVFTLGGGGI